MLIVIPKKAQLMMPWKNGGGMTREIFRCLPGSNLDTFEWRISVATVGVAGRFSTFPDVDRSLALIDGELQLGYQSEHFTLTPTAPIFEFAGEETVNSSLIRGPVTDFNVMTRRHRCKHKLARAVVSGSLRIPVLAHSHTSVLYVVRGDLTILCSDVETALAPGDAILLSGADQAVTVHAPDAEIMVVNVGKALV